MRMEQMSTLHCIFVLYKFVLIFVLQICTITLYCTSVLYLACC
jgi:hypothetical protein